MTVATYIHSLSMLGGFIVGAIVWLTEKGSTAHRMGGRVYAFLMLVACVSSFLIGKHFSFLHVLSIMTLYWLCAAIMSVRLKKPNWQRAHAEYMASTYIGIWIAGIGVVVRHFIDPGNANLGYLCSGIMALILVPTMKLMLKKRLLSKNIPQQSSPEH